jgi:CheY-like chemotaxis protein
MPNQAQALHRTILLAEGDVLLRAPLAEYLRDCGFKVVEATSVDEAKQALADRSLAVSSVVTSVQLAGDGFGISKWAKTHRPDVNVAISGTPRRAVEIVSDLCRSGDGTPAMASQHLLRRVQQMQATRKPPNVA